MDIPASVKAIGRAGAGVNNIPVDKMSKRGVLQGGERLRTDQPMGVGDNANDATIDGNFLFAKRKHKADLA